jgi:adenine-specific DNA-methyltransferase
LPELLAQATKERLTEAEAWALVEALRVHEPWLEWAGKREAKSFSVDPVALHIHERVSTQAILKVAAREDVNRSLFADPEQEYNEGCLRPRRAHGCGGTRKSSTVGSTP